MYDMMKTKLTCALSKSWKPRKLENYVHMMKTKRTCALSKSWKPRAWKLLLVMKDKEEEHWKVSLDKLSKPWKP
jgi:hypothetical protein